MNGSLTITLILSAGIIGCTDLSTDTLHVSDEVSSTLKPAPGITELSFHRALRSPVVDLGPMLEVSGRAVYSYTLPATRSIRSIEVTIALEGIIRPCARGGDEGVAFLVDGVSTDRLTVSSWSAYTLLKHYTIEERTDRLTLHVEYRITEMNEVTHTVEITHMWLSCKTAVLQMSCIESH